MKTKGNSLKVMRWIARIFGAVLVIFTLIMLIGEYLESRQRHQDVSPLNEYSPILIAMFIVWGLGLAGLLIGWWKEKLGGFLSLICFILVPVLNMLNPESSMNTTAFFVMLIYCVPSLLFIACWRETMHK